VTWLTPLTGLILAAAVIPPLILLYFLKLRRRSQPIACTLLWQRSIEDLRANAPFQRLRKSLLLLLQLLALGLLIASVMQPQIEAGRSKGGRTVLLIDNSASMTTVDDADDGRTRLDKAKALARDRIEALYGGGLLARSPGETMVVAFSDRAEITSRFSSSKQELLGAVERIMPTHGETRLAEALTLARAYTTNVDPDSDRPVGAPADLEVFSDGRIDDLDEQVLRGERMIYHRFGDLESDNVTVGAVSVERPYDRPAAVEVFASLLNFNRAEVTCDLQLSVNLDARAVEEITLPAAEVDPVTGTLLPGRNNVVFTPFEEPRGAVIEVANLRADGLLADNVAQVVVPPPKQLAVALVAPKSFLIRSVLEGLALRRLELLTPDRFERLAEEGGLEPYDVIVFDDYAPPPGLLPPGRYLAFGAAPPLEGLNPFGEAKTQIVLNVRNEHPAMRFVRLDDLFVLESTLIQPAEDVAVLAEGSAGPLIVAVSRGPMQLVYVTFDPARSNWPLQRSWVTFVFNAVDYLGHVGAGLTASGFAVGEALTARLPASATDVRLDTPDETGVALTPPDPSMLSWGPIRLAGLYHLTWTTPGAEEDTSRTFAVNLLSESEGRIDALENLEIGQETIEGTPADASAYTPLWPYAIGLCLLVLMFEWWVYHRKTYL
jgi:hypothetical protein